MYFLKHFYLNNLNTNLINRFNYNHIKKIPKLKKIVLSFSCNSTDIKQIALHMLALEFISNQKGIITRANKSNVILKIRKGNPVGCTIILRKHNMFNFLYKFIFEIVPKIKNFEGFKEKDFNKTFSYSIKDIFLFEEIEKHYQLFNLIKKLNINFVISSKNKQETIFLLSLLNFYFNDKSKYNSKVECNLAKIKVEGSNPFTCLL